MAAVTLTGVHKFYGDVHAVKGIDLAIDEDELAVLVGPSGCGKSTLLRMVAGLESVDEGTIQIDGRTVNHMRPRDRNIAMVFQNYALYPYLSVYDNIAFGLRARKAPEAQVAEDVRDAAEMLGITELLDRYPRQLSGGQRQRVAIGRAVVRQARLFLFDEPLSNLDAQLREVMRTEIKRLHQDLGKTMVYVTHDQIEAMTLADRVVLLRDGVIEQQGSPLDLFERPATRFVAGFLGSPQMNFIPVTLEAADDGLVSRFADGTELALPADRRDRYAEHVGRSLIFGARPEHIRFAGAEVDRPGVARLTVTVDLLQPTGSRIYATFALSGDEVMAELHAHEVEQIGETVELAVDMNRTILIDPRTDRVL